MEKSQIFDLLEGKLLHSWRKEIEEAERNTWFFTNAQETFEKLGKELNEKEEELLESYSSALENKLDFIYYNLGIKILNYGIKIGMEVGESFGATPPHKKQESQ